MKTIEDVIRAANRGFSKHWFSHDSMKFFNSRVYDDVYPDRSGGAYFITSEQRETYEPRLFSLRHCRADGNVSTVGEFQQYKTKEKAMEAASVMVEEFDWQNTVPTWVILEYAKYKPEGSVITGWKATPKGGKLYSVDGKGIEHVRQYIKK